MIYINKQSRTPLYEQIYNHYVKEILSGTLKSGTRLPATRQLAYELSVGRNTVDKAYQQLVAEGYLQSKVGSGFVVNEIPLHTIETAENHTNNIIHKSKHKSPKYDFVYGSMDNTLFPYNQWRKSMNRALNEMENLQVLPYPEKPGELKLRQEISRYLYRSRAVRCTPEQVVITCGQQHSMEIIANMFKHTDKKFTMEDPGYDGIRQIFINHGFKMNYIPVEDDGISLDKLKRTNTDLLYVTPSHQFPTGAVMSIGKRKELLQWAEDTDTYLIEDDYDSELRYYTNPIPSLQSLDEFDRTIYTGTFSKSLAPSMRLAYIVFPKPLMTKYSEYYWRYNAQVTTLHQLTLADFMESGYYDRLINRLRTNYKKKQDALIEAINTVFGDKASISGAGAGIHLIINVKSHLNQSELVAKALEHGIKVYSTDVLYMDKTLCPKGEIQLGFPTVPQEAFEEITETLKSIWIIE